MWGTCVARIPSWSWRAAGLGLGWGGPGQACRGPGEGPCRSHSQSSCWRRRVLGSVAKCMRQMPPWALWRLTNSGKPPCLPPCRRPAAALRVPSPVPPSSRRVCAACCTSVRSSCSSRPRSVRGSCRCAALRWAGLGRLWQLAVVASHTQARPLSCTWCALLLSPTPDLLCRQRSRQCSHNAPIP